MISMAKPNTGQCKPHISCQAFTTWYHVVQISEAQLKFCAIPDSVKSSRMSRAPLQATENLPNRANAGSKLGIKCHLSLV